MNFGLGFAKNFIGVDERFILISNILSYLGCQCAISYNIIIVNIFLIFNQFNRLKEEPDIFWGDGRGFEVRNNIFFQIVDGGPGKYFDFVLDGSFFNGYVLFFVENMGFLTGKLAINGGMVENIRHLWIEFYLLLTIYIPSNKTMTLLFISQFLTQK